MNKVVFTQDIGVQRYFINELLAQNDLLADWSLADGNKISDPENIIALVTAQTSLPKEKIEIYPHLKVISMSFTGYDHVDKAYCLKNNISVFNVPAYSTDSVSELAIGLAISLLREIPKGNEAVRNGDWNENISGIELAGKTCGIIGTGTIGCRLAEILRVFKCELLGWSRTEKDSFKELGGGYLKLNEVFEKSDIIFVTIALNENTKDLISSDQFNKMHSSAFLVNVARGPVINRESLIYAVNNKLIAGVGLDVYDYEPLTNDDELRNLERSVLTPHVAYRTKEALERKAIVTVENIMRGLNNQSINRVI